MGLDDRIRNAGRDIAGEAQEAVGEHQNDQYLTPEGEKNQTPASAEKAGEKNT